MKLYGRLMKENYALVECDVENNDGDETFHQRLEKCFVNLCRDLDVSVPIWIDRNTTEFACFRKTYFTADQFIDKVRFERLQIQLEDY